jgi:hypothetical protein
VVAASRDCSSARSVSLLFTRCMSAASIATLRAACR